MVISSSAYQRERADLIILAVTSQLRPAATVGEVQVKDWKQAGLLNPAVMTPVIATIERRLVRRRLGKLSADRPGWPGSLDLVNDWANFTVYLSCFVFGYMAGADPRLAEAAARNGFAALALGLAAFAARLACYAWLPVGDGYQVFNVLAQFLRGLAGWWLIVAAIGLGRRYLTATGRALGIARDLSFPLYLLHYAPVTAVTYFLLDSGLGIWPRWALSVLLTWATVALCTFVFRFVPPLRALFGIRAPAGSGRG